MRVHVLFFGPLAEAAGGREHWLELAEGARLGDCLQACEQRWPALASWRARLHVARNLESTDVAAMLAEGDEIALLPPVSGGSGPG